MWDITQLVLGGLFHEQSQLSHELATKLVLFRWTRHHGEPDRLRHTWHGVEVADGHPTGRPHTKTEELLSTAETKSASVAQGCPSWERPLISANVTQPGSIGRGPELNTQMQLEMVGVRERLQSLLQN